MNAMERKGYTAQMDFETEDKILEGKVLNIKRTTSPRVSQQHVVSAAYLL